MLIAYRLFTAPAVDCVVDHLYQFQRFQDDTESLLNVILQHFGIGRYEHDSHFTWSQSRHTPGSEYVVHIVRGLQRDIRNR